jgi:cohesin complex subunit SA-1/2
MHSYPVISNHPSLKWFNRNFKIFWESLVKNTKDDVLFSKGFLDTLIQWMLALSGSAVRAFRHTATLTLYHMMGALIETLKEFRTTLATTEKQLKAAQKKKDKKAQKEISTRSEKIQEKIIKLEETINSIFKGYVIVYAFN